MRNYHIYLASGEERNIKADSIEINSDALYFFNSTEVILIYAAGSWIYVEVERLDDKGYPGEEEPKPEPK